MVGGRLLARRVVWIESGSPEQRETGRNSMEEGGVESAKAKACERLLIEQEQDFDDALDLSRRVAKVWRYETS